VVLQGSASVASSVPFGKEGVPNFRVMENMTEAKVEQKVQPRSRYWRRVGAGEGIIISTVGAGGRCGQRYQGMSKDKSGAGSREWKSYM
jgi:hypothetical protein